MTKYLFVLSLLFSQCSSGQIFADYAKLGFTAQQSKNYQEAITQYSKAQKIEPHNTDINRRIGLMYYYLPKYDSALFYYNLVLTDNPKDSISYYQRGFVYLDSGEYQRAVNDFTAAFNFSKTSADACFNIGKSYSGLGDFNNAIEYYKMALTLFPNDKFSFYEIGYSYASASVPNNDSALKYYNKAIEQDKNYYEPYFNRGLLYAKKFQDLKRAHQDLEKSIAIRPKNQLSYLYNGLLYFDEKEFGKAKDMYDKVIAQYSGYGQAYYERARAWYGIGILNMVCKDLDKAEALGFAQATEGKKQLCK